MTPNPRHKAIGWLLVITGWVFYLLALVFGVGVGGVQLLSLPTLAVTLLALAVGWIARVLWQRGRYGLAWVIVAGIGLAVVIGLIALIYALAAAFASGPDLQEAF